MYQIGQQVIYGSEGTCTVKAVGALTMRGIDRDREYYTLSPLYREGTIYAPVDTPVFMRPILTREEAEALIASIVQMEPAPCSLHSVRELTDYYQSLLHSHSCENMVLLIKTALSRRRERQSHGNKPGQVDERFIKRAEDLLCGELAASLGTSREDVWQRILPILQPAAK